MNSITENELTHERLGADFDEVMNEYDIQQRLTLLIDTFLHNKLEGALVLDAGCGTGRGSERLVQFGANVVSVDLGSELLNLTRQKCDCHPTQASVLDLPFTDNTFDIVFSTEVIEHTPDPTQSVIEMVRVIKPNGLLCLSTPNLLWQAPVRIASMLHLRPYNGLENFISPSHLQKTLSQLDGDILEHRGIHLLPFQFGFLHPFLRYIDQFGERLLPLMINQAILFRKGN